MRQASALTHESVHASPQIVNREQSEHNCMVLSPVVCHVYKGGDSMEIETEADSKDVTECSHDDMPSTGMSAVSETDDTFSVVSVVYISICFHL